MNRQEKVNQSKYLYFLKYGMNGVLFGNEYACNFRDDYSAKQECEKYLSNKKYQWARMENRFGQIIHSFK